MYRRGHIADCSEQWLVCATGTMRLKEQHGGASDGGGDSDSDSEGRWDGAE